MYIFHKRLLGIELHSIAEVIIPRTPKNSTRKKDSHPIFIFFSFFKSFISTIFVVNHAVKTIRMHIIKAMIIIIILFKLTIKSSIYISPFSWAFRPSKKGQSHRLSSTLTYWQNSSYFFKSISIVYREYLFCNIFVFYNRFHCLF